MPNHLSKHGSQSDQSPLSGVLLIDKPAGITSHDAVAAIRQMSGVKGQMSPRVGHTGTLDPFATGLLIIAVGPATRLIEFTHDWDKTYKTTVTLGAASDTDDKTGKIITSKVNPAPPTAEAIAHALHRFTGTYNQIPPAYAAIKIKGKKMYELARAGKRTAAAPRPVTIHSIELNSYTYPELLLTINCSTGTYIRALARDIGQHLKTGAYVSQLRRTSIGAHKIANAVKIDQLSATSLPNRLLPPSTLIAHMPSVTLSDANVAQLRKGQAVQGSDVTAPKQDAHPAKSLIAIFDQNRALVAIARFDPGTSLLYPSKVFPA